MQTVLRDLLDFVAKAPTATSAVWWCSSQHTSPCNSMHAPLVSTSTLDAHAGPVVDYALSNSPFFASIPPASEQPAADADAPPFACRQVAWRTCVSSSGQWQPHAMSHIHGCPNVGRNSCLTHSGHLF